jgi:anion-transporting  ArsA/GET3 family ATPase
VTLPALDRRLLFVTGKGGVGKTTVAAALALLSAERGRRTLVCEVDAKGTLADALETGPLAFTPRQVQPSLWAMAMNTEDSLREYLSLQLHVPLVARIGPLARTLDFVASAAPGVKEILTVGKLCYEVREVHYDLVVVDAAASGHVIAQLSAARTIKDLVQVGVVRDQTSWMLDILGDVDTTGALIVTSPEEMPVNETIDLVERLRTETNVDLAAIVVNRVLPELFGRGEEEVFEQLAKPAAVEALEAAAGRDAPAVLDAARLAVQLRRTRAEHLTHLRAAVPATLPMAYVPELFARLPGLRAITTVAQALDEELGA